MSKKKTTAVLSALELQTKQSGTYMVKNITDDKIDYSDIPKLTAIEMKKFRPLTKKKRKLFSKIAK